MRSKNTLYIVLGVGLIIFIVSLVIGRPVWQAAFFSIGFLLVAAIVTSRGLLIPEALFSGRFPRRHSSEKPTESTDKAEFMKGMEATVADLSTGSGAATEDAQWITEYTQVMEGIGDLIYEVHESVRSKDRTKQLRAFRRAVKQLPSLISEFKNIPKPITPKRQETMKRQAQGMDLYLLACSDFAKALETSDGELAGQAAKQINKALNLLDIMDKPSDRPRPRGIFG